MTVLITLTTAGTDSGPFDLYSDLDGYTSAFESGVPKASLLAGYASALVPDYTNIIRVKSNGDCVNYIDIPLPGYTTTTTTTTVFPGYYVIEVSNSTALFECFSPSVPTTYPITLYYANSPILIGDTVYYDSALTNPFVGDNTWYWASPVSAVAYQINPSGVIVDILNCELA